MANKSAYPPDGAEPAIYTTSAQLDTVPYKSYWEAVYFLLGIWALFRTLVVISLYAQDSKWKTTQGDTRNLNLAEAPKKQRVEQQALIDSMI